MVPAPLRERLVRLLRWSEQYTKTDMVYLTKGMSWLSVGQGVAAITALVSSVAFANLLSPEVYGEYRYALSMLNLLAIPTLLGMNTALMRSAAQGLDGSLLKAFKTRLAWGIWGAIAGIGIALYYLMQGNQILATNFLVLSFFAPLFYSFEVFAAYLRGKKLFKYSTVYTGLSIAISTASLVTTLFFTSNVALLLISYFLPYTILRGLALYVTVKKHSASDESDPNMVRYGKHLSVMGTLSAIAAELDKLLLWHFIGPVQLAIYSFAIAPVKQMFAIKGSLGEIAFPKMVERETQYVKKVLYPKIFRLFALTAVVVFLYILLAPFLYAFLFPKYIASVIYSQVYALTFLFAPFDLIDTVFSAHKKVREQYYMSVLTSVGKITLFIILIPFFGIWGVIVSILTINAVRVVMRIHLLSRLQ